MSTRSESVERRAWTDVYSQLAAAGRERPLDPDELERLATAAWLIGRDDEAAAAWGRAHQAFITSGHVERAARSAFWLAFGLLHRGERARGAGWVARARRLLEEREDACAERGYLLLPAGMERIGEALAISERTVERHVSNMFNKLGVSSRAAATAAAYERQLL